MKKHVINASCLSCHFDYVTVYNLHMVRKNLVRLSAFLLVAFLFIGFSGAIYGGLLSVYNFVLESNHNPGRTTLTVTGLLLGVTLLLLEWEHLMQYVKYRFSKAKAHVTLFYLGLSSIVIYWGLTRGENLPLNHNFLLVAGILSLLLAVFILYKQKSNTDKGSKNLQLYNDFVDIKEVRVFESQQRAVNEIVQLLDDFSISDTKSLSVAINGAWGDGKTTAVDKALSDADTSDYIIVRFEPWRYTNEESIVSGFYDEIGKAIQSNLPDYRKVRLHIAKYAKQFMSIISRSDILTDSVKLLGMPKNNYDKKINDILEENQKNLIVVIDDIDRIHNPRNIIRVFQLAQHLKSDIPRSLTLYLVDMNHLNSRLIDSVDSRYFQKIYDITHTIFPPRNEEIIGFVNSLMSKPDEAFGYDLKASPEILHMIRNYRGAKRVLSTFNSDVKEIGDNVSQQDMFFLRTVQYAYPSLYSDINENYKFYFPYSFNFDEPEFLLYGFDDDVYKDNQKTHFKRLFESLGLSNDSFEKKRLVNALVEYFPALKGIIDDLSSSHYDQRALERDRRIGYIEYLRRYFSFSRDVDKKHAIEESFINTVEGAYGNSTNNQGYELLKTVLNNTRANQDLFYSVALSYVENLSWDGDDQNAITKRLLRDLLRLVMQTSGYITRNDKESITRVLGTVDKMVKEEDLDYIFREIQNFAGHPSATLRLLLYMHPTRDNSLYRLKKYPSYNKLRAKLLNTVDNYYLDQGCSVFSEDKSNSGEWRFILAQWATSVSYSDKKKVVKSRFNKVNDYVIGLLLAEPKLTYKFIMDAFWLQDLHSMKYRFNLKSEPQPYDFSKISNLVEHHLRESKTQLTQKMTKNLNEFLEECKNLNK